MLGYVVTMATGSYKDLNNLQCATRALPTRFRVDVNVVNRLISATPSSIGGLYNIEARGLVAREGIDALAALSLVSTTAYTSVLGNMLHSDIFNVKQSGVEKTTTATIERGVAESLQVLSDQYLFSTAGAQLMTGQDVANQPVDAWVVAMRIWQDRCIYASAAINTVLVIVAILAAVRTRLWRGMPRLDYSDVKSVMIASSAGGPSLAEEDQGRQSPGDYWVGNASDRKAGGVKVFLQQKFCIVCVSCET